MVAAVGGGVTGLFLPALWFAKGFRRDNIRIRLYEIPLAMATDGDEAARYLREAIGAIQPGDRPAEGGGS